MSIYTIDEILTEAERKGYPLESMRFFVGENRADPRCFGIYYDADTQEWVVYKNKSDGSRAVRYQGPDEAEACSIFWAKIEETYRQGGGRQHAKASATRSAPAADSPAPVRRRGGCGTRVIFVVVIAFLLLFLLGGALSRCSATHTSPAAPQHRAGYYTVDDELYYYQGSDWYWYSGGYWVPYYDYDDTWYDGYYGSDYSFADPYDSFAYSDYYDDYYSSNSGYSGSYYDYDSNDNYNNSDYDYNYAYDSDSYDDYDSWDSWDSDWDSGWDDWGTDWDSDW